jgi:hypothetical protein
MKAILKPTSSLGSANSPLKVEGTTKGLGSKAKLMESVLSTALQGQFTQVNGSKIKSMERECTKTHRTKF